MTQHRLSPDEFREVMGRFASGVTVITTTSPDGLLGATASAVTSLSLEPPMLVACINSASATGQAIARNGCFGVNILGEDHSDLAMRFASRTSDKFEGVTVRDGLGGVPLLEDAIAVLECEVAKTEIGGTHYIFLSEVRRASGRVGAPLAYFRGEFGRMEFAADEAAARAVRELVMHRRVPIGRRLDLDAIAAEIEAPRASVYHALANLCQEGLIDRDNGRGFVVPPVTRDALVASARARIAIFVGAAVAAVQGASRGDLAELWRAVSALTPAGDVQRDSASWFADRRLMVETMMRRAGGGQVLVDAFHYADVPAQIHHVLFGDDAPSRAHLSDIHAGYVAIFDAAVRGDYGDLAGSVKALTSSYDDLYASVADEQPSSV